MNLAETERGNVCFSIVFVFHCRNRDMGNLDDRVKPHGDDRRKVLEAAVNDMPSQHELEQKPLKSDKNKGISFDAKKCKLYTTSGDVGTITEKRPDRTELDDN